MEAAKVDNAASEEQSCNDCENPQKPNQDYYFFGGNLKLVYEQYCTGKQCRERSIRVIIIILLVTSAIGFGYIVGSQTGICASVQTNVTCRVQPMASCEPATNQNDRILCPNNFQPNSNTRHERDCTIDDDWIIFQRRSLNDVDFRKTFLEYEKGFGNACVGDFWLGLRKLSNLTSKGRWQFYSEVETIDNRETFWVRYDNFSIGPFPNYELRIGSIVDSNFADEVKNGVGWFYHRHQPFSTYDRDVDSSSGSCSNTHGGGCGFWFKNCMDVNVNAPMATIPYCDDDYILKGWMKYRICTEQPLKCQNKKLAKSLLKMTQIS